MEKVSVIVPVYNAEKYIERCLNSIINQTRSDLIELIVINDGSKDNSEEIIKKIKQNCNIKFKYYAKKNEGVAKTRNFGIKKASCKYTLFVDCDDKIDEKLIEKLVPYIEKDIDCIKFKLQEIDVSGNVIQKYDGPVFEKTTGEEGFNKLFGKEILIDSPCIYLIKKEVYIKNNLYFERTYHEDFGLMPFIIVNSKTMVSTPYFYYSYIQEENSIMRNNDKEKEKIKIQDCLAHFDKAMKRINEINLRKDTKENLKIFYTNAIILKVDELNEENKKYLISEIKKRKMYKNIKIRNLKQLIKKILLMINVKLYLKMR